MKHRSLRERHLQQKLQSQQPKVAEHREMSDTITIKDTKGNPHEYYTESLGWRAGKSLDAKIKRVAGSIATNTASAFMGTGPILERHIQPGYLNEALGELLEILSDDDDFRMKLYANTARDGVRMDNWGAFEIAYTHNYLEETRAMLWLIKFNFFDPFVLWLGHQLELDVDPSNPRQVIELFSAHLKLKVPQLSGLFGDSLSEESQHTEK